MTSNLRQHSRRGVSRSGNPFLGFVSTLLISSRHIRHVDEPPGRKRSLPTLVGRHEHHVRHGAKVMTITPIETEGCTPTRSISYLWVVMGSTERRARNPAIPSDGLEAVRSCASFINIDRWSARIQASRHLKDLVALRWRGDPATAKEDLAKSSSPSENVGIRSQFHNIRSWVGPLPVLPSESRATVSGYQGPSRNSEDKLDQPTSLKRKLAEHADRQVAFTS